jgi:hypothetical protein
MSEPISGYAIEFGGNVSVYVSDVSDSHSTICEEFGIRDIMSNESRVWAFDFGPDIYKPSSDVSTWNIRYNSAATCCMRQTPDIETEDRIKSIMSQKATRWIYTSGNHVTETRGFYFGTSTGTVVSGYAKFYENSSGIVESGFARFYDNSKGIVRGGQAWFYGKARKVLK